jgi:4-amino-4-deoxy-L-arabinose transferase-like glycosyltransferase
VNTRTDRFDLFASRWFPLAFGALLRLLVFPWTENLWGDAPVRTEIARRWAEHPGLWWSFKDVFQFGPLPIHLGGLAIRLGLGEDAGPRLVALLFGMAGIWLAQRLASKLSGEKAALVAGYAVALNPLYIQASTTFVSEAIYTTIVLACLDLSLAKRLAPAGLAAAAATVTRFDSWLWLPLWAAWLLWKHRASAIAAIGFALVGPLSIITANWVSSGHPLAPLTFIEHEHTALALRDQAHLGAVTWRVLTFAFWPGMLVVAMTPGFALLLRRRALTSGNPGQRVLVAIPALVPPLLYSAKTLVLGAFWPMPRLIVPTSAVLSTLVPAVDTRRLRAAVAGALAVNFVLAALVLLPTRVSEVASRLSPIVRLPEDLRAGIVAWREVPAATLLDEVPTWEDIAIAYHAGYDRDSSRREARARGYRRVIALRGGPLDLHLRATSSLDGRQFQLRGERGRVSWWDALPSRQADRPMDE